MISHKKRVLGGHKQQAEKLIGTRNNKQVLKSVEELLILR